MISSLVFIVLIVAVSFWVKDYCRKLSFGHCNLEHSKRMSK